MSVARIASRAQLGLHAPLVHVEVHLGAGLPQFQIVGLAATAVKESKERVRSALLNSGFEFPAGRITVNLAPADVPKDGGRFDLPIALGLLIATGQVKPAPDFLAADSACDSTEESASRSKRPKRQSHQISSQPSAGTLRDLSHAVSTAGLGVLAQAQPAEVLGANSGDIRPAESNEPPAIEIARLEVYGELALGGELKPVKGLLLVCAHAAQAGHDVIVPAQNVDEACIAAPARVYGAGHLLEVCKHIQRVESLVCAIRPAAAALRTRVEMLDLMDVRGQLQAKRALTIAAAGSHSLLLVGPPGSGKSMLAHRLPGLLPGLTSAEALEVAMVASASVAGFDARQYGQRPFRSPHHTASTAAMIGGGVDARPGEISLAHRGVLFLDELPEFERRALEALREPLETGVVSVSRVAMRAEYPAEFQLVVAMNPCPCGYWGDVSERCECTPGRIAAYRARVSGPLLDRIDLRIVVPTLRSHELSECVAASQSTAELAEHVRVARERQLARAGKLNSRLSIQDLSTHCGLDSAAEQLFWQSQARLGISARSYHRTLRVARTIADLEASEKIHAMHVAEALQLKRALD